MQGITWKTSPMICHKLTNTENHLNNHVVYEHKDEHLLVDDNILNETETMEDNVPEI